MRSPAAVPLLVLSGVASIAFCNERPVVGVLAQETYWSDFRHLRQYKTYIAASYVKAIEASGGRVVPVFTNRSIPYYTQYKTYIAASYVKAIEASGGRVVPVFTNRSIPYYTNIIRKVNGILVPGGMCAFDMTFGIGKSTFETFIIAQMINDLSDHFPILGVCLGFELLLMASINGKNPLIDCDSNNMNLPLKPIPNMIEKSVLFRKMPKDIQKTLLEEPVTANHHSHCITPENFTSMHLNKFWNPITTNEDDNNLTFISTIEAKNYPFVGVQFHPEKNAYEWQNNDPHSRPAIHSARYFYDWFIDECRRNKHSYEDKTELEKELIYNYPKTYVKSYFEEVYFFKK